MSHISDVCGMVVNLAMAVGLGWANKDTYPYIVWDHWVYGWNYKDFYEWGLGFQILFAELAKYDAPV